MKSEKSIKKTVQDIQNLRRTPLTQEQVERINKVFEREVEQDRLRENTRKIASSTEPEV